MYLGVCIDSKLNFVSHVSQILKKVYHFFLTLPYTLSYFKVDVRMSVSTVDISQQILNSVPVWKHSNLH